MIDALLDGEFCTRWLITLLHLCCQVGLVWLFVWIADRRMQGGSAAKRYQLHTVALLAVPILAIATFCFLGKPKLSLATSASAQLPTTVPNETVVGGKRATVAGKPAFTVNPEEAQNEVDQPTRPASRTAIQHAIADGWHDHYSIWIVAAYALCVSLLLLRLVKAAWSGHRLKANSSPIVDSELLSIVNRQAHLLGVKLTPVIARCEYVAVPTVIGVVRPMILLPGSLVTGLTIEEFGAVISHELAHVCRRDLLINLVQRVIEAVFFFHPAVWYFSRRISEERELCCDDLVVRAGHEPLSYASALLRLAETYSASHRKPTVALTATGESKGQFEFRIERLISTSEVSRMRMTRLSSSALILSLLLGCLAPLYWYSVSLAQEVETAATSSSISIEPDSPPRNPFQGSGYAITGTVRDRTTKRPIANADTRVLVVGETRHLLEAVSDNAGQYRIEVPVGHVRFWYPRLRAGYWMSAEDAIKTLTTSPEEPTLVHDVEAEAGSMWPLKVEFDRTKVRALNDWTVTVQEIEDDAQRKAVIEGKPVSFQKHNNMMIYNLSSDGVDAITQVGNTGRMIYRVGDANGSSVSGELLVDPGFDNERVEDIRREETRTTLTDAEGNQAVITNADVDLNGGVAQITLKPRDVKAPPKKTFRISGRVVDAENHPVPDARVGLAFGSDGGSADTRESAQTDAEGKFVITHSRVWPESFSRSNAYAQLNVNKAGLAAFESKKHKLDRFRNTLEFGELKLEPGYSLPVRIVDESGKPLPGATIEPQPSYALRRQVIRVDEKGRGVIRNLPAGVVSATVTYHQNGERKKLVVGDADDNQEVTIILPSSDAPKAPVPGPRSPIEIGMPAPDWLLGDWMDGKSRQLSDFRGRVLVLDFWGVWCGPCVHAIPSMKELEEHYASDDVAFVAIHTPDGDPTQIARLQELKKWKPLTAVDLGTTNYDGETAAAYGVRGYPTVLVIDQQGQVAFSTDDPHLDREQMMERMEELAESRGYAWPIDEEDHEKMIELGSAFTIQMLKEQIDKVASDKETK